MPMDISKEELEAESFLIRRLREIDDEDVINFRKNFNEEHKHFKINNVGALHLLRAKIEREVYDEFNAK